MDAQIQNEAKNYGQGVSFTCPGCYADLAYEEWRGKEGNCPKCNNLVQCYVYDEPVSMCELVGDD